MDVRINSIMIYLFDNSYSLTF